MDRLDALEKLYRYRFEAIKNGLYFGDLSAWYSQIDSYITLGVLIISAIAFGLAFIGALRGEFSFKRFATSWWGVGIAAIPTVLAFVLVFWNPSKKALEYDQSYARWQDIKERDEHLQNAVVALKGDQRLTDCLMHELDALDSCKVRVETMEPRETNEAYLDICYNRAVEEIYSTASWDEIAKMMKTDSRKWARLKYGFVPDDATLNRLLSNPAHTEISKR
jgi:hypothetical protein